MVTFIVIAVVSGSLVLGAAWGIYGNLPDRVEGLIVALAGGALMISAVLELIEPASHVAPFWAVSALVLAGAVIFAALDHLIKERAGGDSGGGLLAAITLDGIPENLALGVALISTGPLGAAALSGSILLSNLPEAAGGAREMTGGGTLQTSRPGAVGRDRRPPHRRRPGGQPPARRRLRLHPRPHPQLRRRRRRRLLGDRSLPQGLQGERLLHRHRRRARPGPRALPRQAGIADDRGGRGLSLSQAGAAGGPGRRPPGSRPDHPPHRDTPGAAE